MAEARINQKWADHEMMAVYSLSMAEPLVRLEELYSFALSGSCPSPSLTPVRSSRLLRGCLCAQTHGECALELDCENDSALELRFVSLTVLEVLLSRLTARSGTTQFRVFAEETVSLLQSDVLHALLQQFHSEDQLLSHLTVKCLSASVLYQLHHNDVVSPEWSRMCLQAASSPSRLLDSCVRSLTEVLRHLLKGAHHELIEKVLTTFDHSVSGFCSQLLLVDRGEDSLTLVLDLMELLCACRTMCGDSVRGVCSVCVQAAELLALCSCPLPRATVRRQGLLLLKRVLVQRVAEDWVGGNQRLRCRDLQMLGNSVLKAAAQGWVKGLHVEGVAFFGGTGRVTTKVGGNVNNISLRAVCLILLKSMELQCQADAQDLCLQCLWDVLQRCGLIMGPPPVDPPGLPSGPLPHSCSWLSAVFADQDDDMMEAAKALLCIYLHHRQHHPSLNPDACSSGYNPHCHFLLLLHGLAFDHRTLLDFLISTETCFLEYCIRYFRFLRTDPEGFKAACSQLAGVGQEVPLVDYPSSSESDTEEMEMTKQLKSVEFVDSTFLNSAVVCLCELREVVSRLHKKKLFPYNPTSLTKLLTEVVAGLRSV